MTKALYDEILSDGKKKADAILKDAEEKRETILAEARKTASQRAMSESNLFDIRVRTLSQKEESEKKNIERLVALQRLDVLFESVEKEIERKFNSLLGEELDGIIAYWIAEAAMGIGEDQVEIVSSKEKLVSEAALLRAKRMILEASSKDVDIRYIGRGNLDGFGILARNKSGQISYTNTLPNRIKRYKKEIRKIIQGYEEDNRESQKG